MAIYVPGRRNKKNKIGGGKRNVVAVLQLTAMVDMFTVLVVFLLQNYASTNQILPISEQVSLPTATSTAELTPSLVVILSKKAGLRFESQTLASFNAVKNQDSWMIQPLREKIQAAIIRKKIEAKVKASTQSKPKVLSKETVIYNFERMTLQADESIDFLTIKKLMYTLTAAGIKEINFAVVYVKEYPS